MTVQATTSALAPAAVATRVIAFIIDGIILGLCSAVIGAIVGDTTIVGGITRAIIYAVLGFLYFGYTWTAWRASPGQRILGLMTVDATSGAALSWNQATMRWAFLFGPSVLNSLFPVGGGLGAIVGLVILVYYIYLLYTAATDARKQGFHDKQANTLVITKPAA
ncbi:MAG: RDD family protein [Chloroflexota bacterium]